MKIIGIIILATVIYIIFKFLSDVNKQKEMVKKSGGMQKKYQTLLNYILAGDSRAKVLKVTDDSIIAGAQSIGGTTLFILTQTFGNITIQWKVDSPVFGKHSKEWIFSESIDQEVMFDKINNDLTIYQSKLFNQ